jgi:hypothetical protein
MVGDVNMPLAFLVMTITAALDQNWFTMGGCMVIFVTMLLASRP